ncbi:MAG: T9SS type A sorting domain-containing protein, partial [Calditrichaeota bacterium]|nr:T9SS type A sorting domain-containing protein [Calditrichota bacterium]
VQVTVTFSADEVGYHTATITSESNAWDPQEINFRIVGEVAPVFRIEHLIPDINMEEDEAEILIADLDTVFISSSREIVYQILSAPGMTPRIERNGSFYIRPRTNFFGVSDVVVAVNSQDSTLTDTFSVYVSPLPDPPDPFDLIAPIDSSVIHPTESDSLFIWQSSIDPDGDTLLYDLAITNVENHNSITFSDLSDTTFSTLWVSEVMDIEVGGLFAWYVTARDSSHERQSQSVFTNRLAPAGVNDLVTIPESINFAEVYPNPFNSTLIVDVNLKQTDEIIVQVFDLSGRSVGEIYRGISHQGKNMFHWTPENLSAGIYFIRLSLSGGKFDLPVLYLK